MKPRTFKLTILFSFLLFIFGGLILVELLRAKYHLITENDSLLSTGLGSVETLEAGYKAWAANFEQNGGERNIILPMKFKPSHNVQAGQRLRTRQVESHR